MKTFLSLLFFLSVFFANAQDLSLYDLNCEHLTDPMGIESTQPRLGWKIRSSQQNVLQTAYAIRVSERPDFSGQLFWDSEKVLSSESALIPYNGPKLKSTKRYYWQVKVWDNHENESDWSEAAYWEMGILDSEEWKAAWIEPVQDTIPDGPALYVRKEFNVNKEVKRARAYATAHGIYHLHLNGKKVGDELLTPGWTTYTKRLQYQVYDITDSVQKGENAIGAVLGDGWYRGYLGWEDNWGCYGKKLAFLCQVEIEYTDGTKELIITDASWKGTNNGPITMNSIYNGENYDATKELTAWDQSGYDDGSWQNVQTADYGVEELIASESVPVKRIQDLTPVKIWKTPKGTLVADMGQNMVGWIRLKANGSKDSTITIRHAEVMDKEGEFYTENLRVADATVRYTLKGEGEEVYEPSFTFMGFRYVAIEGYPGELKPEHLTGIVIHSDMKPTGTFECSNPLINQLQENIQWGQRGNFLDIPTDCPQRDERLGWTGDAQAFVRTAAYNMDVASFFSKWLKDVAAEQDERGAIPFTVPNILGGVHPSAGWSDVGTIGPWTIYQVFGDRQLLKQQYPSMKAYVDFVIEDAGKDYIWQDGSVFGDWLFFKPELKHWTVPDGHTDQDLIATAFFAYSTKLLSMAARELGKMDEADGYMQLFDSIKEAFNRNYVTPEGRISSDSQTAYVLALMFDLLPENLKSNAVNHLVNNIQRRDNHLSTGFLGTPFLCHVLSDNDRTDVAYDLLLQETFPSWLYPVKMGATTIWERWDGMKPDSTFQNKDMNSFNHYAYGAIGDWMYRVVTGIEIGAPGYKKILLQPKPDSRLDYAKATYESRYGEIVSEWKMEQGMLTTNFSIPPNTTATIILPSVQLAKLKQGNPSASELLANAREHKGNVVVRVGSGDYAFSYNTSLTVKVTSNAPQKLVHLMDSLAKKEKNPLLKRHFETVAKFTMDTTHGFDISESDIENASRVLNYFHYEGSKWETYVDGPRPLMMSFQSSVDGKYSYYWLFLPRDFDKKKKDYPLYVELHGSGGGKNDNPREMLYRPLQPEVAGVTSQGYRKEGFFIYPWARGDKWYRDEAEADVFDALKDFDEAFTTDPRRQYLYGFSMGGGGTLRIAQKLPDLWTAIGIYSGAFTEPTPEEVQKLKDLPVWMTWGELEKRLTAANRKLKGMLMDAGADVKWREVKGVGHRYLGEYQEDLMDWLSQQVKE